ncbi:MAG: rRNA maturation RNase YbeY [Bacteroides sp.]|nr:rRNA maturation RNase YbeY [Ruminococcus flavefaciens]MCM1555312.1 rRNA maturation RNase YbeY [Bacteroides sp.]
MKEITFIEQDCRVGFMRRNDTRARLLNVLKSLGCVSSGITYIFCSDKYLLKVNKEYLNHDTFTDVITFDYTLPGDSFPIGLCETAGKTSSKKYRPVAGDIYISVERIKENAKKFQVRNIDELNRVMIHGILHLAGYHDKTPREEAEIHQKEDEMLEKWF